MVLVRVTLRIVSPSLRLVLRVPLQRSKTPDIIHPDKLRLDEADLNVPVVSRVNANELVGTLSLVALVGKIPTRLYIDMLLLRWRQFGILVPRESSLDPGFDQTCTVQVLYLDAALWWLGFSHRNTCLNNLSWMVFWANHDRKAEFRELGISARQLRGHSWLIQRALELMVDTAP